MKLGTFLAYIANEAGKFTSCKEAAEAWGVSSQYLADIIKGKREPGPKILDALGFEKMVSYHRKENCHE